MDCPTVRFPSRSRRREEEQRGSTFGARVHAELAEARAATLIDIVEVHQHRRAPLEAILTRDLRRERVLVALELLTAAVPRNLLA